MVKVTVTQKWYATLSHPKMYLNTKSWITISNNIGDMLLEMRSEFKVTVTQKWYGTLPYQRMHQFINLEFLPQKYIGDMQRTQCERMDGLTLRMVNCDHKKCMKLPVNKPLRNFVLQLGGVLELF